MASRHIRERQRTLAYPVWNGDGCWGLRTPQGEQFREEITRVLTYLRDRGAERRPGATRA